MKKILILLLIVFPVASFAWFNIPSVGSTKTATPGIKNFGSYRAFSDGTYPSNCQGYKTNGINPYVGDTGDGIYRVNISGVGRDVYCLMTYDSNGWARILNLGENGIAGKEVTTSTGSYQDNYVVASYALSSTTSFILKSTIAASSACLSVFPLGTNIYLVTGASLTARDSNFFQMRKGAHLTGDEIVINTTLPLTSLARKASSTAKKATVSSSTGVSRGNNAGGEYDYFYVAEAACNALDRVEVYIR